jgi:hypothetical protein
MSAKKSLFFLFVSVLAIAVLGLVARPAFAGGEPTPFLDHLKCYGVTEDTKESEYLTVELLDQFGIDSATVRVVAQYFCAAAARAETNGTVKTTDSITYISAGDFICYALKTRTAGPGQIFAADPFGERTLTLGSARLLCAPAVRFQVE